MIFQRTRIWFQVTLAPDDPISFTDSHRHRTYMTYIQTDAHTQIKINRPVLLIDLEISVLNQLSL